MLKSENIKQLLEASQAELKLVVETAFKAGPRAKQDLFATCGEHLDLRNRLFSIMTENDIYNMDPDYLQWEDYWMLIILSQNNVSLGVSFATKLLGHRFSLPGIVPVPEGEGESEQRKGYVSLTNFYNTFVPSLLLPTSIQNYIEHFQSEMPPEYLGIFQKIYQLTRKCLRSRVVFGMTKPGDYRKKICEALLSDCKNDIAMIYTGYEHHDVCLIIARGRFLYRCNKGACSPRGVVVEKYAITNPSGLTVELLEKLQDETHRHSEDNKRLVHQGIHQDLGLELLEEIQGKLQVVSNCCWTSKKMAVRALMHELVDWAREKSQDTSKNALNAEQLFKSWVYFDRRFYFNDYITRYRNSPTLPFVLRRMICQHFQDKEKDLELGSKIIDTLRSLPNFEENKLEFLIHHWLLGRGTEPEKQKQFVEFLKRFGVDLNFRDVSMDASVKNASEKASDVIRVFVAIQQSDIKTLAEVLKSRPSSESLEYLGWTPLHIAVGNNDPLLIGWLIGHEPKWVNAKNFEGETPLFYAKDPKIAKTLIAVGADMNECIGDDTPLNRAASRGNVDLVQFYLENGAKTNDVTLHCAVISGSIETARALLQFKPSLLACKNYGYSLPIHAAAALGRADFVQLFLDHGTPLDQVDVNGNSALHLAAKNNSELVLQMLVKVPDCSLSRKNYQNKDFLAYAIHLVKDKKWLDEITKVADSERSERTVLTTYDRN